jgi:hypothetical protein
VASYPRWCGGFAHRGKRSIDRHQGTWPNPIVVHTPVHASRLNQGKISFSVVQRKSSPPTTSPTSTRSRRTRSPSGAATNKIAAPLQCTYTRQDLHKLLAKTDTTQPAALAA